MANNRELDHQYRMAKLQAVSLGWRRLLRFLSVAAVCTCVVLTFRMLAGQHTFADITFKAIADLESNRWFALIASWVLTGGASLWAVGERTLRKRHIKREAIEGRKMQNELDPGRRSSRLTVEGATRPEDE